MRHLVRNASLPMVTLIGLSLPVLLAGNLITESLFNYQGLGLLFFESLQKVDYPVCSPTPWRAPSSSSSAT